MLDTILQIGKALRKSKNNLKHHRYVRQCPIDGEKTSVIRLNIPVKKDFTIDIDKMSLLTDENIIEDNLYYLRFKTSDSDSLVKYIYGDIFYSVIRENEGGYYRMADKNTKSKAFQVSSFKRGIEDSEAIKLIFSEDLNSMKLTKKQYEKEIKNFMITGFRKSFEKNLKIMENILKYPLAIKVLCDRSNKNRKQIKKTLGDEKQLKKITAEQVFLNIKESKQAKRAFKTLVIKENLEFDKISKSPSLISKLAGYQSADIFIHYDFSGRHWYDFHTEFDNINSKLLSDFVYYSEKAKGYCLKKYLYKTIGYPGIEENSAHKGKLFKDTDEIMDLIYAIDYSQTALLKPTNDMKIVVLPRGNKLGAKHYENFLNGSDSMKKVVIKEEETNLSNKDVDSEYLFVPLTENIAENIVQYDLIFSKKGGTSSPDVDLVEISGLNKSGLTEIHNRIRKIKLELYLQRKKEVYEDLQPFDIKWSFINILGDNTKDKKKYQWHLFKVLPRIYKGTYYNDPMLLPILIDKTEENIRDGNQNFNFLKYDFYFLMKIQNTTKEGENLMKIQESKSYAVGILLGKLALPLKFEIKAFEKSYVGNLRRRISTLDDLLKFKTYIEEKLIMHEKNYENIRETSLNLAENIKNFVGRFDKNECAFGFFESYFTPFKAKENNEKENN